jgi:DNA primase
MGMISEESIRQVLAATDIVELVGSYLPLKRAGASWKGMCPFHNDSHPSLTVTPAKQLFKCFACGTGGDAISFVQKYENISFSDAVHKLAERAGIPISDGSDDPEVQSQLRTRRTLIQVNKVASDYFHHLLIDSPAAEHARNYLKSRGLSMDVVQRWGIGWAPQNSSEFLHWAEKQAKIPVRYLMESGLADVAEGRRVYARFRDRLMFPIRNTSGECVAFSGRVLGQAVNTGKYINSPETPIFKKGQIVFGLDRAKASIGKLGYVLICEGQLDVIAIHEAGFTSAVAPLGTAFTSEHAKLLRRYTSRALLCFDSDSAGMAAADKAFAILAPLGMDLMLVTLPAGDDPDSLIKREGSDAFARAINEAKPFFEARVERARMNHQLDNPVETATFINNMVDLLLTVKDHVQRDLAISDLAMRLHIALPELRQRVQQAEQGQGRIQSYRGALEDRGKKQVQREIKPIFVDRAIVVLSEFALQYPEAQTMLLERYEDLLDPMEWVTGSIVLKHILEKCPQAGDISAIQAYIHTLQPEEALALQAMHLDPIPIKDLAGAVEEACSGLSKIALANKRSAILAELKSPRLQPERSKELMSELVEIQKLIRDFTPES